ncbi:MAG: patatin-like phospholipase family protein [Nanoarchaeota archaeon]|nr:patatin-like phospholipase family protein [Nanoarchaeota archaeon]
MKNQNYSERLVENQMTMTPLFPYPMDINTFKRLAYLVSVFILQACAPLADFPDTPHSWVTTRSNLKDANSTIKTDYAIERQGRPEPKIGLALSGGGTRAGMFAFGVLSGLNDANILNRVNVISSVSGGGYAAYWFYARKLEADRHGFDYRAAFADCRPDWWVKYDHDDGLNLSILQQGGAGRYGFPRLEPCTGPDGEQWSDSNDRFRWQAHVARHPDVFRQTSRTFVGTNGVGPYFEAIPTLAGSVLEVLIHPFVPDGILGEKYEKGISRTWGLTPKQRIIATSPFEYENADKSLLGGSFVKADEHTWEHLRALHRKDSTLPLWIINTTVAPKTLDPDERNIFELTAFSYGSALTGFLSTEQYPDPISELPQSVRASAAAADSQGYGTTHWRRAQAVSHTVPALRWGVTIKKDENNFGKEIGAFRLSDGGGSDNLGLISLVRRGIPDIILVDAEADIEGRFEGLCWDKEILSKAGYDLKFENLKDLDLLCEQRRMERLGKTPEIQRAYNVSAWLNPIILGSINPSTEHPPTNPLPSIRVWLIKLAWNQAVVHSALDAANCESIDHPVSCLLTVYHAHQPSSKTQEERYQMFPHLSTMGSTWNASTPLFWAWRELGRFAASLMTINKEGKLSIRQSEVTPRALQQPLLFRAKNRQAVSKPQN